MTQEQFIKKYNLKEVTEPIRNSDGKYIEKLVGYETTVHYIDYDLYISVTLYEKASNIYRLKIKNKCITNQYYQNQEIFAMHTVELPLAEKITEKIIEDLINDYINL